MTVQHPVRPGLHLLGIALCLTMVAYPMWTVYVTGEVFDLGGDHVVVATGHWRLAYITHMIVWAAVGAILLHTYPTRLLVDVQNLEYRYEMLGLEGAAFKRLPFRAITAVSAVGPEALGYVRIATTASVVIASPSCGQQAFLEEWVRLRARLFKSVSGGDEDGADVDDEGSVSVRSSEADATSSDQVATASLRRRGSMQSAPFVDEAGFHGPQLAVAGALKDGTSELQGSASHGLTSYERTLVERCLQSVERRAEHVESRGMNPLTFFIGVTNTVFVAWVFGCFPQHFWIVYLVESAVIMPLRGIRQYHAKPLNEMFFWFDLCWVVNFCMAASVTLLMVGGEHLASETKRWLVSFAWGFGCGPMLTALGVLGNALLFHDVDNTASVFIHLFPSLTLYCLRHHAAEVDEAWPGRVPPAFWESFDPWQDIFWKSMCFYAVWFVAYTSWLLGPGMDAPLEGKDTMFHFNMRQSCLGVFLAKLRGQSEESFMQRAAMNQFTRLEAIAYMSLHAKSTTAVVAVVSLSMFRMRYVHAGYMGLMFLCTVYNAGKRYSFYVLKASSLAIRDELGIPFGRGTSVLV